MKSYTSTRKFYAGGSLILGILLLLWPAGALRIAGYAVGFVIMASGIISFLSALRSKRSGFLHQLKGNALYGTFGKFK